MALIKKECSIENKNCVEKTECFLFWTLHDYVNMYNILNAYPVRPCKLPYYDDIKKSRKVKCSEYCFCLSVSEIYNLCKCFDLDISSTNELKKKLSLCDKDYNDVVIGLSSFYNGNIRFFQDYDELIESFMEVKSGCSLKKEHFVSFSDSFVLLKFLLCALILLRNSDNDDIIEKIFAWFYRDGSGVINSDVEDFSDQQKNANGIDFSFLSENEPEKISSVLCDNLCEYLKIIGFSKFNKGAIIKVLTSRRIDSSYKVTAYQPLRV